MDCASTILPITPPAEFAAHMSTGSRLSCCAVIRCRLPNNAFDEVSLPVSATPSHPRNVPKKGNSHPVRVNARPSTASRPEYRVVYPRPSMNEIAMTASFMRFSVDQKILASWTGPTPRARPAMIAAMKHPVPVAESQLKSKRAASGVSLATTGAARDTALCSSGTFQTGVVARLMAPLIAGRPHANTVSDRIANGIHALRIWPAVYLRAGVAPAGAAARSPSNLQTRFGRQNRRKTTVASSEMTPPAMSTRFESTWLDQRYCVTLNDAPTTRIAGSTSK